MFSIVSMQDVLINLNGGEELFKKFDHGGKSRKRSTSVKSPNRKDLPFSIQNIWILPSHVLVLSNESNNVSLLAYNQYPKMSYLTSDRVIDLFKPLKEKGSSFVGVCTVFSKYTTQEFVFILMKDGQLVVWMFTKPSFEWKLCGCFSLCKGKGCQLTNYSYNEDFVIWCEKRSTAQCCICVANIEIHDDQVAISNKTTILHNCLPMHIHPVKESYFCLFTTANRPPGLILFWNCHDKKLMVRVWNDGLMSYEMQATSSDFQNIITSSIPIWINSSSADPLFVTMNIHATTKELIFLQQDLSFYLMTTNNLDKKIQCVKLFHLEVKEDQDIFVKRIFKMYLWHRLVLLNMLDGELLIFDSRNGLFLWKTDTFKLNSPKVWVCMGPYPSIGVWNRSGIWTFRPKSIRDQVKEIHADFEEEATPPIITRNLPDITDVDYAVNIIGEHNKEAKSRVRRRIKQGVNRKAKLPISYMFEVLNKWKSERTCSELALHLMLKHIKKIKADEEDDDGSLLTSSELVELISHIHDPVLLMALFTNKALPTAVKRSLVTAVKNILNSSLADNISPQIINILKEYVDIQQQIESCYFSNACKLENSLSEDILVESEYQKLFSSNKAVLENILRHLIEIYPRYVTQGIIPSLLANEDLYDDMWHVLLKNQSFLLYKLIPIIWNENALYLFDFIETSCEKIKQFSTDSLLKMNELVDLTLSLIHLTRPLSNPSIKEKEKIESSVCVYCKLLLLHENHNEEKCCEIYLKYGMLQKAIKLLNENNSSMFYRVFKYLLLNNSLKNHIEEILPFVPKHQNVTEMCNMLLMYSQDSSPGNIYVNTNSSPIDMETVTPIFELLFKRNLPQDES